MFYYRTIVSVFSSIRYRDAHCQDWITNRSDPSPARTVADQTIVDRTTVDRTVVALTVVDRTLLDRTLLDRTLLDRTSADRTTADGRRARTHDGAATIHRPGPTGPQSHGRRTAWRAAGSTS